MKRIGLLVCAVLLVCACILPVQADAQGRTVRVGMPGSAGTSMVPPNEAYDALLKTSLWEVAKYTDWQCEFVYGSEQTLLTKLSLGEIDMIAGVYDRDAFAQTLAYPRYHSGYTYAHLVSDPSDSTMQKNDFRSLQGRKTAAVSYAGETRRLLGYLALNNVNSVVVYCDTADECLEMLRNNEVDMALVEDGTEADWRIITSFVMEPFYVVTSPYNQELLQSLQDAYEMIYAAEPDFAERLHSENFDVGRRVTSELTPQEIDYLQSQEPLRFAVIDDMAPLSYYEEGKPKGILVDILAEILAQTGLTAEYVRVSGIPQSIDKVESGEVDAVLGVSTDIGSIQHGDYVLTNPVMDINMIVLTNRFVDYPSKGMTLALVPGMEYMIDEYVGDVVYADSFADCIALVNAGTADYTYGSTYFLAYGDAVAPYRNTQILTLPDASNTLAIGLSRPVEPKLLTSLNKIILGLPTDTIEGIVMRNTALREQRQTLQSFIYAYPTLIVTLLTVFTALVIVVTVIITILRARHSQELFRTQYYDDLTGALNLPGFRREAARLLQADQRYALSYIDMRNFQLLNDRYGYEEGDRMLEQIADLFRQDIGDGEVFCRISGSTFACMRHFTGREALMDRVDQFRRALYLLTPRFDSDYHVKMVEGIYINEAEYATTDILGMLDRANITQQMIKESAELEYNIYQDSFFDRIMHTQEIESKMDAALEKGEFLVYFQPKYSLSSMRPAGAEALVRWKNDEGIIPPDDFIPLFERNGFIAKLDSFVFTQTCRMMRKWLDEGKPVVPLSVNVSRVQLYVQDFVDRYVDIKRTYNIPDGLLEIEVTESVMFEDVTGLIDIARRLQRAGFKCSIDDFGKGYSSLTMLKNIPVNTIKLDAQFFEAGIDELRDDIIVRSVIDIAKALKMTTVAEGIESREQVQFLQSVGCDMVQGYVFSRPLDVDTFERYLHEKITLQRDPYAPLRITP